MTSKEALEQFLWLIDCLIGAVKDGKAKYLEDEIDISNNAYNELEKDLEILDILRKHSTRLDDEDWNDNIFNGIDYENLDEKERKIIKEWLENE